ncbi:MAG: hypothetical protein EMLJLAPB_00566 [Candidatus Argoarchaeum ethanivorans]|uniref:Uncharacterized protein n=1 Tax=Candidatus Argoarchaeum ethanivorans TaxID=2608793 RepID=A0A811TB70_9EURY|nr:MAG: hypothetical protein EMLJLAPB_00566 [Candidatus Argoarchaeum ethanivorans]
MKRLVDALDVQSERGKWGLNIAYDGAVTPSGVGLKFWFFQISKPEAADTRHKSTTSSKQRQHHAT